MNTYGIPENLLTAVKEPESKLYQEVRLENNMYDYSIVYYRGCKIFSIKNGSVSIDNIETTSYNKECFIDLSKYKADSSKCKNIIKSSVLDNPKELNNLIDDIKKIINNYNN
jgi:hypothetical protein